MNKSMKVVNHVFKILDCIVKILNIYIMLSCTHLYHFFPVFIHYLQCILLDIHPLNKTLMVNKRGNKRVLNFVQQVFFLLSTKGSLEIIRAYQALYLGGTPSLKAGTSPPSCLHLDNLLYMMAEIQAIEGG